MSIGGTNSNYGGMLPQPASSINDKGTLYAWYSAATAYMDVVSKINNLYNNLQQNFLLIIHMDLNLIHYTLLTFRFVEE